MGTSSKDPNPKNKNSEKGLLDEILDFGPQSQLEVDPSIRIKRILSKLKELSRRIDQIDQDM